MWSLIALYLEYWKCTYAHMFRQYNSMFNLMVLFTWLYYVVWLMLAVKGHWSAVFTALYWSGLCMSWICFALWLLILNELSKAQYIVQLWLLIVINAYRRVSAVHRSNHFAASLIQALRHQLSLWAETRYIQSVIIGLTQFHYRIIQSCDYTKMWCWRQMHTNYTASADFAQDVPSNSRKVPYIV